MTSLQKNIWEIANELSTTHATQSNENSNLLFIGNGGKTSIINRFLDKNDTPKPTVALEYVFAKKAKSSEEEKNVCDVWELGGGSLFTNLIDFAVTEQTLLSTSVVLVIDLSLPEELIITSETLLEALRDRISLVLNKSKTNIKSLLNERALQRVGDKHEDKNKINAFPIPLLIIGSKYDLYQDFDSEKKKLIVRYLRLTAHSNGAQLMFVSTKSEALINKCRQALNNLTFQTPVKPMPAIIDYSKPISISFGCDSFQLIGHESIESVKRAYITVFPQLVTKIIIPDDPSKDINFKERDIDLIRAQKDKELEDYKRQLDIQKQSNKQFRR